MKRFKTIEEVKQAIDNGDVVYWVNNLYKCIKDKHNHYLIICTFNDNCVGIQNYNDVSEFYTIIK